MQASITTRFAKTVPDPAYMESTEVATMIPFMVVGIRQKICTTFSMFGR